MEALLNPPAERRQNMDQRPTTLVVVSYYDRRPLENLLQLLASMEKHDAGESFSVCIVVNRTSDRTIDLPGTAASYKVVYRNNTGMNIGAWDHGWRQNPEFEHYLFLQDECYIVRSGWISAFKKRSHEDSVGMVGESANNGWAIPWTRLRQIYMNTPMPEHLLQGQPVNRVDCYLHFLRSQGIPEGRTGEHLRSLVWFLCRETLERINGFPIGLNYGECIAAEIAVSKKIAAIGQSIVQVEKEPFYYVRHVEWNQDLPGDRYSHKPFSYQRLQELEANEKFLLDAQQFSANPSWNFICALVARKIKLMWKRDGK